MDYREQRTPHGTFERFSEDLHDGLDPDAVERPEYAVLYRQLKRRRAMM